MYRLRSLMGAAVVGVFLFFAGCTDAPTTPPVQVDEPDFGILGSIDDAASSLLDLTGQDVAVLERSRPLDSDEVVSETIGYGGGIIRLPESGLTVFVPWGAVRAPTRITVTAPAGDLVGYHFEPHGLEFRRPVTLART